MITFTNYPLLPAFPAGSKGHEGDDHKKLADDKDILVHDNFLSNSVESIRTSKFCLAPYGHGWGVRLAQYITYGCVPVIVQQKVYQPLEDVLPYEDFALRLPR